MLKDEKDKSILFVKRYNIIRNNFHLKKWIEKLKTAPFFAIKTQTYNLDDITTKLIGISLAIEPGLAAHIPISYDNLKIPTQLTLKNVLKILKPIMENEKILKLGQNIKHDHRILQQYNIKLRGIAFDTMLESYIINSVADHHDEKSLANRWLTCKSVFFEKKTKNNCNNKVKSNLIKLKKEEFCAAEKADITLRLHNKMWAIIKKNKKILNIFQNIDIPLVPVLSRIERNGVKIDPVILENYSKEIELKLKKLEQQAYEIVGKSFNISSTNQLKKILFEKQGIKPSNKTIRGSISTSEKVLKKLSLNHLLPRIIIKFRKLSKLKSTYTDKLPLMINPKTNRIHTSYHQAITTTGRLSSTNPNLQNIPVQNKEGNRIRKAFIAPKNYVILSADYSQIELRIMAHFSRDSNLLAAFSTGKDIHLITASEIFNIPVDQVTEEQRSIAKAINFGLIYGMSPFGLSNQLDISYQESKKYIDFYFNQYPGIYNYINNTIDKVKLQGYVETLDGRQIYFPDIKSSNNSIRAAASRSAINAKIQGTAADIIKKAMITVDDWIEKKQPRVRMIMQVHDELVFEVHKEDLKTVSKNITKFMESGTKLEIPLLITMHSGENWDFTH